MVSKELVPLTVNLILEDSKTIRYVENAELVAFTWFEEVTNLDLIIF